MLRLITPGIGQSVLRIAATSGILVGAFALFQLGYLILTVDALVKLSLTFLYTRFNCEQKSKHAESHDSFPNEKDLRQLEPPQPCDPEETKLLSISVRSLDDGEPDVVGCVVGWREDEELYARCLESLRSGPNCTTIVAGIDGDEIEDANMVDVFQRVSYSLVWHPLTPVANLLSLVGQDVRVSLTACQTLRYILMASCSDCRSLSPRPWNI